MWLLIVTLLGGAFLVQRGNQPAVITDAPPPPAIRSGSETGDPDADAEFRMQSPLREFLGLPTTSPKAANSYPPPVQDKALDQLATRIKSRVGLLEFLVVMVADPIETATNYRFDLQLDTLHKALGADGYVPDHFYLPWGSPAKVDAHRTEPAVLLYRRNGTSLGTCENPERRTDLLVVYLIGETPTSGIHKEAFLAAMEQITTLGKLAPCPAPNSLSTIRIAGPLFTGAADSLALAIRQAREDKITAAEFQVITGTAVSIDIQRFRDLAGPKVELHSTVLSGAVLKQALIQHVVDRTWSKKVRIAWLVETGTGYGSSVSTDTSSQFHEGRAVQGDLETRQKVVEQQTMPAPEPEIAAGPAAKEPAAEPIADILEFRFPVNISKVRSGYAETRRRERASQASLGPESSRLPIPFDDTTTARDVPPMQTPKVTAPTVELILSQILTTIRNEGIKHVGISSSDPRDPIFLAELIKEQCPDAQIMLVTSDLLHLHSEYRSIMHGTLVSSTHPLHPEAQDWCFPFGEHRAGNSRSAVMSSQSNYGLYNAILFLRGLERGQYQHVEEGEVKRDTDNLLVLSNSKRAGWPGGLPLGYSMPFQRYDAGGKTRLRPPVWISRISPQGITPITVEATDKLDKAEYTLNLRIDELPSQTLLPVLRIRSRIPPSLYIASLLWLVMAAIYCTALLSPQPVGNWAKVLVVADDQPPESKSLVFVFRCYLTGAFLYVLIMFGSLFYVFHRWVGAPAFGDYLTVIQCVLCYLVASILTLCLLVDWCRACGGLCLDLRSAFQHLTGRSPAAASSNLSWHLLAARAVGLTITLALVVIHVWAAIWQQQAWGKHPNSFLWFKLTSDMWNGLSPAMTAQVLAVALIILAYGMLLQMHLLSPGFTIHRPDLFRTNTLTSDQRLEEVRYSLLFPLLSRWRRDRPVILDVLSVAAAIGWLGFLGWHLQSPDHFAIPFNFPTAILLVASGYWCLRIFKLIQILKCLARHLEEFTKTLRERWPESWTKIFDLLPEKRIGLQELFWTSRPTETDNELAKAKQKLVEIRPDEVGRLQVEQRLCALEIELYVRQFFHHIFRLGFGLAVTACLLFLSAQTFPFSQEPLLRLSASIMLASIGAVMAWYYIKFDRNELLSHLVGTNPKEISINWSMIQMIAPAFILGGVALLSQTFPDLWQWLRGVLEPVARSSI